MIQSGRPRVLVVEDDFLVREFAAGMLEDGGFDVVCARNAREALNVLEARYDIDVLFTDINMPGSLDGFELARNVAERWPDIGLLLTSGRSRPAGDLPDEGRFIEKPYLPETVVRTVEELARTHRHH